MKIDAWHLPWGPDTVSHAIIDINRGCNITCRACYNALPPKYKTIDEIEAEIQALKKLRPHLGYVAIAGGEVLLHPMLCEIIRLIKSHGLVAQLFTNGLLLTDSVLAELKSTGLEIIFVHIDSGQTRPDMPERPTRGQLLDLWAQKTELIARHGIDAGLTMTVYEDTLPEARDMIEYMVDSPHVNYLLVTLFRDTDNIASIKGDIAAGMTGALRDPARPRTDTLTNRQIIPWLLNILQFRPFGYLGSCRDAADPRWLSYLVATHRDRLGKITRYSPRPSSFEQLFCKLSLVLNGKFPMYQPQSSFSLVAQLIFNSLMGGDFLGNLKFLGRAMRRGELRSKRILFQCPAQIEPDGSVTHCENCPDAVVKNGGLVPLCISDKVS